MADTDFNIIKPVESLQNVQGLSPTRLRDDRRRRKPSKQHQESSEDQEQPDDSGEEQKLPRSGESHAIDYCA